MARAERPHVGRAMEGTAGLWWHEGGVKHVPGLPHQWLPPASPVIGRDWDALSLAARWGRVPMSQARTGKPAILWPVPSSGPTSRPASMSQPTRLASEDVRRALGTSAHAFGFLVVTTSPSFSPKPRRSACPFFASPRMDMHTIWCGTSVCQSEWMPDASEQGLAGLGRRLGERREQE